MAPLTPLPLECPCLMDRAQGKCGAVGEPCVWYFPLLWQKVGCTHYKTHEMGSSEAGQPKVILSVHSIIKINFFDHLLLTWSPSVFLSQQLAALAHIITLVGDDSPFYTLPPLHIRVPLILPSFQNCSFPFRPDQYVMLSLYDSLSYVFAMITFL